jgi:hypothetical protein
VPPKRRSRIRSRRGTHFSSPRVDSDQVAIDFDWNVSQAADDCIRFHLRISRQGQRSAIDFAIDLRRLKTAELEQLRRFLVRWHARLDDGYELARSIVWLLDISLQQRNLSLAMKIDA